MPKPANTSKLQPILYSVAERKRKAGAGVLFFAKDTDRFLVLLRSGLVREPYTWSGVGGKIDDGEAPFETAKREVFEEMGVAPEAKYYLVYVFKTKHNVFTYFNFLGVVEKEFEPTLNNENLEFKWLSWKELAIMPQKHYGLKSLLTHGGDKIKRITKQAKV